jgi:GABA permease
MRNPFGSEAAAFRFLLLTLVALAAVALAAFLDGPRVAVPVWAAVSAAAVAVYVRRGRRRRLLATAPAHVGSAQERRLLVLAQEPLPQEFLEDIGARADRVLVVSAAVAPALRRWVSDVDDARERARRRVEATVSCLRSLNADAAGAVGDEDPLRAVEDALRTFGGDEIVVSTPPGPRGEAVVARIRERFALPVTHVGA